VNKYHIIADNKEFLVKEDNGYKVCRVNCLFNTKPFIVIAETLADVINEIAPIRSSLTIEII
jgi:hypothetical protein